jgi:hypothetical protein
MALTHRGDEDQEHGGYQTGLGQGNNDSADQLEPADALEIRLRFEGLIYLH